MFSSLVDVLARDLRELDARPTVGADPAPNRPFRLRRLADARARFELIGVVNRPDRSFVEGLGSRSACGEARLVYRLVLEPAGRPPTALPMTVNVVFPQPAEGRNGPEMTCRPSASRWRALEARGASRLDALAALFHALPPFIKVETSLQNLHGPALRAGEDDHAEYLMRTFTRRGEKLVPELLLDTPRDDLDNAERAALASWIREHFEEIDRGVHVIPERFLAKRAISVAPRGLSRRRNRIFARMFGDGREAFGSSPFGDGRIVKSARGLVRRLDQGTPREPRHRGLSPAGRGSAPRGAVQRARGGPIDAPRARSRVAGLDARGARGREVVGRPSALCRPGNGRLRRALRHRRRRDIRTMALR